MTRPSIVEASASSSFSRCSLSERSVWYASCSPMFRASGELAQLVRLVGGALGLGDHPLHLVLVQARAALDADLLLVAGAEVLAETLMIVRVDVERDLDLRHAARCGRDAGRG